MAKGDRGSRGRKEYGSGSDHRRGTTYRDRDRADRNRDRYEQQQRDRDEQRKREEAARREAERKEAERKEAERKTRQAQQSRELQKANDQRRAAVSGQTSGFGSVIDRIGSVFSDDVPKDITDDKGNVVAQSFGGVEAPVKFQSIDFNEREGFETAVPDANPYTEYAQSVVSTGPVGESPQERQVQQGIYEAGKQAQAEDVAGTLATAIAGPIGAVPGIIADTVRTFQDDPIQQAGEELYESGKVNIPGASAALSAVNIPGISAAFEVANSVFGGSRNLDAFQEQTGVSLPRPTTAPANFDSVGDSEYQIASTSQPAAQPVPQPQTMAQGFQLADWDQNVYSDFLNNFFKQGA